MATKMTREEAINIVRNIYQTDKEKEALATLIPELAESEDERIRRWLCDYFSSIDKAWIHKDITCIDILRYLEKQKEQKPAEKHDLVAQLREHFANTPKEQLEAEWKELEHWNNIGPSVEEYFHRIKPAEWSEEDEKKIIFLERLIEHNVPDGQYGWVDGMKGGFVTKSEAISMLKSLRPQYHGDVTMTEAYKMGLEAGKASSWKPSEEQMNALYDILHPADTVNRLALESLYEQLKAL